jgi:serine phosphatase RsbU (regulator of sigma subunit)/anti-sigma regulatory factor (Ser/Thr protein kinase)
MHIGEAQIDRASSRGEEGAHARAVRFLLRLQRVTEALTPQLRTDEIARTIVDAATQVLGADIAGLFMPDGDVLQPIARSGDPTETSWDGAAEVALDSPLAIAEAFRSGRTIWAPRNEEWRRLFPSAPPHYHRDVEGVLAVPLRSDGEAARGVLGALFRRPDALDEDERRLATTIGQQAAQAIERALLFESERDLADRATALRKVAAGLAAAIAAGDVADVLVGAAAQAVGAQAAAVGLVDLDTDTVRLARTVGADPIDIERCVRSGIRWPGSAAMAGRGPVWIRDVQQLRSEFPDLPVTTAVADEVSSMSWASVPLVSTSGVLGFYHACLAGTRREGDATMAELRTIAAQASQALDRARLFEQQREVAETLQRSLLPRERPSIDGLSIATRYRAGAEHLDVGGDWYEVVAVSPDVVGLAIGDVVGRGVEAASTMGQLRSALRALAMQGIGPRAVLDGLEVFAQRTPGAALATVIYGELDTQTGEFRFCCAGHPPPLLETEGEVEVLQGGRSPLLGVGPVGPRAEATAHLAAGATLLLYTDGLVERRGEHFDRGIQRLARALGATATLEIERRADAVLLRMLYDTAQRDDVAVLCVCRTPAVDRRFSEKLHPHAAELSSLRMRLGAWLTREGVDTASVDTVVLAANEALANAIEHGRHGKHKVAVTAWTSTSSVTVEVRDRGTWRNDPSDEDRGHGLLLMRATMDTISIEPSRDGTTVRMQRSIRATAG